VLHFGGPVFLESNDPLEIARAHRRLGYRAAYCPNVGIKDNDQIRAIEAAFKSEGVVIAEVGAWKNLLDNDPVQRKENINYVIERLAVADEVGALCCVDISGSFHPDRWDGPHPDNLSQKAFDMTVQNARTIIDAVKPKRAKLALEMMPWALPDSPESFVKLIEAVNREQFAAHLDPVNIINSPTRYFSNTDLLEQCFRLLGGHIVSCHAKDTIMSTSLTLHIDETIPGTGALDYRTYLTELAKLPQQPPLLLEHLSSEEEYDRARRHLFSVADELGLEY